MPDYELTSILGPLAVIGRVGLLPNINPSVGPSPKPSALLLCQTCSDDLIGDELNVFDNFYKRGVQYDARYAALTADINFYEDIVREFGGPVLELACGTGRVTIPVARGGIEVVGCDIEESMLSVARNKALANTEFIHADMRAFSLARKFQTVILAFNSLGHLYDLGQVEQCFRCVKAHMEMSSVFVVAMFNPKLELLVRSPNEEREISRYEDPESGDEIIVFERVRYDRASQIMTSNLHYVVGGEEFENQLRLKIFFPKELQTLLHYAGFKILALYGDFDRSSFVSESPHQIYVASATDSSA